MANNNAYSIGQPLRSVFPSPIIQKFDPKASNNQYQLGQVWINKATQVSYILAFISPETGAEWNQITNNGGDATFTNLTVSGLFNVTTVDEIILNSTDEDITINAFDNLNLNSNEYVAINADNGVTIVNTLFEPDSGETTQDIIGQTIGQVIFTGTAIPFSGTNFKDFTLTGLAIASHSAVFLTVSNSGNANSFLIIANVVTVGGSPGTITATIMNIGTVDFPGGSSIYLNYWITDKNPN